LKVLDRYSTDMNTPHLVLIDRLFTTSETIDLPLWLQGGWAIDAKLYRITREHQDIDLTFPAERKAAFISLLRSLGGGTIEETDYGFLIAVDGILVDCEPCVRVGDRYEVEGLPPDTCPWEKQGSIAGKFYRCNSWEVMLWDYFYYLVEVPQSAWRAHDFDSYALVRASFGEAASQLLHQQFRRDNGTV
jgi:aminoglycoside 2''-adenylyltransferase